MSQHNLPELPEPFMPLDHMPHLRAAWAEQMHAYALAALSEQGAGEAPVVAPTPSQQADHSPDGGNMVEQQAGAVTELEAQLGEALKQMTQERCFTCDCGVAEDTFDLISEALAAFEAKKAGRV